MLRPVTHQIVLGLLLTGFVGCQALSNRVARNPLRSSESRADDQRLDDNFVDSGSRGTRRAASGADQSRRERNTSIRREVEALDDLPAAEREEIAANLESLDPATAQIVLRALQQSRNVEPTDGLGGPRIASAGIRSGSAGVRTASGSRVLGSRTGGDVRSAGTTRPRWSENGLGDASPWSRQPTNDHQPTGTMRTALRPRTGERITGDPRVRLTAAESPANRSEAGAPRPSSDRIDQVAARLAGRHPSASANSTPVAEVTENGPVRNAVAISANGSRDDRVTPVGIDRSIPPRFSTTAPGFGGANPVAEPASPYDTAIRHLEQAIAARRDVPKRTEADQRQLVEDEVFLRLLYLADGQEERAIVPIEGVPAEEQEFWKNVLWALANYFDAEGIQNSSDRTGQVLVQLRNAVRTLQSKARLELRNVSLCEEIRSFGDYVPLESNKVPARGPAIVYAEVENFRSVMTDTGDFVTRLKPRIEFYREGDDRKLVESIDFAETVDYSRNHRRDYYLAFDFHLPTELTPGRYKLVLQLDDGVRTEDDEDGRVVTQTMQFEVTQ